MFAAYEHMFMHRELMFTAREHNFSHCKNTFSQSIFPFVNSFEELS